jgi:peptidoglycan/LPS O-acetylase OafA/YrhL
MSVSTKKKGTRKRLDHIDAMRPVKQAAVISTHTLIFFAPLATSTTVVGLIMLTRFSREAFFFVSACMLTFSYRDIETLKLNHYWKRRFVSVGVPFLAWTAIYYFYTTAVPIKGFPFYSFDHSIAFTVAGVHYLAHILLTGYYHLYDLVVLMEFYLLFPLLLRLIRRHSERHVYLVVAAVLWQLAFGILVDSHPFGIRLSEILQTRFVYAYVFYLIGGMIVALHFDEVHRWICAHAKWIFAVTVLSAAGAEILLYWGRFHSLPTYLETGTQVFSPTILPFNVGAILCVYLLGVYLVAPQRSLRLRAAVQSGSDNSYGVYLSQLLWIPFLLRVRNHFCPHLPWEISVPLALVLVYTAGLVFTSLAARTPLSKALTGRRQVSWRSIFLRRHETPEVLRGDIGDGPLDVVAE